MAIPSYLQDEDELNQRIPFLSNSQGNDDDEEDGPQPFGQSAPAPVAPPGTPPQTIVSPQMQQIIGRGMPSQPPGTPPVVENAEKARQALAAAQGDVPIPPKPKWWQRLGAGAVGAMAGISNASGHRGVNIDPTAAEQGIMGAPQFQRQVAQHQAAVTGAQANATAAQQAEQEWWKNRQLNNEEELKRAEAERATKQGQYYEGRNAASEARGRETANERLEAVILKPWGNDWQMQSADAPIPPGMEAMKSLTQPGMVLVHPPSMVPMPPELVKYAPGRRAGEMVPYGVKKAAEVTASKDVLQQNKPVREPAINPEAVMLNPSDYTPQQVAQAKQMFAAKHREPAGDRVKPANPAQLSAVAGQTKRAYAIAEQENLKRIAAINGPNAKQPIGPNGQPIVDPKEVARIRQEQIQASYEELNKAKQQIEDGYKERVGTLTGTYQEPVQFPPIAAQQGGAKPFPRSRLAEFANANKLTPQQAEQRLASQGYSLQ